MTDRCTVSNPSTVSSNLGGRTIIPAPTNPRKKIPYGRAVNARLSSNEGSERLTNPITNQIFLIHSAARSDSRNYCLEQLELMGADSVNAQDRRKNNEGCVFYQNALDKAYGAGHASFTSPGGTEDWIVYHRMRDPVIGWAAPSIRTQQFG